MDLELPQRSRDQAVASLQRYFKQNMPEPIGTVCVASPFRCRAQME